MVHLGQINTVYAMQSRETEVWNRNKLHPSSNHKTVEVHSMLVTNGDA
jgi:hypothetical protein